MKGEKDMFLFPIRKKRGGVRKQKKAKKQTKKSEFCFLRTKMWHGFKPMMEWKKRKQISTGITI